MKISTQQEPKPTRRNLSLLGTELKQVCFLQLADGLSHGKKQNQIFHGTAQLEHSYYYSFPIVLSQVLIQTEKKNILHGLEVCSKGGFLNQTKKMRQGSHLVLQLSLKTS